MEKALLVSTKFAHEHNKDYWPLEDSIAEIKELANTAGANIIDEMIVKRDEPAPNFFIGKGKADEIAAICQAEDIATVIFNHDLSPTHQRNLEEVIQNKIVDRTQLILHIFARHAVTPEGKLQVELAQMQYLMPRLVGKGIMLSRLGGGIGTVGPGEQKLEIDRRRISERIFHLKDELKKVSMHRDRLREKRKRAGVPLIGLVGYTNAGKTTLLNALTGSSELARNSLFTTLDSISRTLVLPNRQEVVLFDTVGFLHKLPHHLIDAFKATLEEVRQADLLLHVLDISCSMYREKARSVYEVLEELQVQEKPIITVLNKIDALEDKSWLEHFKIDFKNPVEISAKNKENFESLFSLIEQNLSGKMIRVELSVGLDKMNIVNLLHEKAKVHSIEYTDKGILINVSLPKTILDKIASSVNILSGIK